ncbi:hypothetical protein CYLTODRAFT_495069 [Cylindrobasidium torrendii FP15055 ss-10]|uniref:Uncharacterized protein n=1 Tax=Cylindrobasidium torrendii FP15055 ss-10 TaxID=1314674 RepID=A0A0D7AUV2_9AGAR|nr:hypothetical protein CYLTODRAFT_495069 [Cylindrobasidium torrendii FP15055 ss-10]
MPEPEPPRMPEPEPPRMPEPEPPRMPEPELRPTPPRASDDMDLDFDVNMDQSDMEVDDEARADTSRALTREQVKVLLKIVFKKFAALVIKHAGTLNGNVAARTKHRYHEGSRAYHRDVIEDRFADVPTAEAMLMRTYARGMFLMLVGPKHLSDFFTYEQAALEDVKAVEDGAPFPENNRTLYFGPDFRTSKWNKSCIQAMATYLIDNGVNDWDGAIPPLQHKVLVSLLWHWTDIAQKNWKLAYPRVIDGKTETPEEALKRAIQTKAENKLAAMARSRKQQKYNKRSKTSGLQMKKYAPSTPEYQMWKQRQDLTKELGVNGMSSEDEEPRTVGQVVRMVRMVKRHRFLSANTTREMHAIDLAGKHATQRAPREYTNVVSNNVKTQAPIGLSEDCYDKTWLASLTDGARGELKARKGPHPLLHPEDRAS